MAVSGTLTVLASSAPALASAAQGAISGSVTAAASGLPIDDVCVYAYPVRGGPGHWAASGHPSSARTNPAGNYQLDAPVGSYALRFDPSCDDTTDSSYAGQYYPGQLDLAHATSVFVSAITPTTGIDAELTAGYALSGTVSAPGGLQGVAGVCVSAMDAAGNAVGVSRTAGAGDFNIYSLPAGTYTVYVDPTCAGTKASAWAAQYYGTGSGGQATAVKVSSGTASVEAVLEPGASLVGAVTAPGALDAGGTCVYAFNNDGVLAAKTETAANGSYGLSNLAPGTYQVRFDPTCDGQQVSYFSPRSYDKLVSLVAGQVCRGLDVTLSLRYGQPLVVTQSALPPARLHSAYLVALSYRGPSTEAGDYKWGVIGLPPGLRLMGHTIGGRPRQMGKFSLKISVTTVGTVPPLVAHRALVLVVKDVSA